MRRFGFRLAAAAFITSGVYYGLFGGAYDVFDIRSMRTDRSVLLSRVDSLVTLTDSLVQRGDSLVSDRDAIERVAREEYGFVRDGELLVRFVPHAERAGNDLDD